MCTCSCGSLSPSTEPSKHNHNQLRYVGSSNLKKKNIFGSVLHLWLPYGFWLSRSSCWAQRWPLLLPHTERLFPHSAAAWSSWKSQALKTPEDLHLTSKCKFWFIRSALKQCSEFVKLVVYIYSLNRHLIVEEELLHLNSPRNSAVGCNCNRPW